MDVKMASSRNQENTGQLFKVWVANWQLRRHRQLIEFATVRLPTIRVNVSPLPFEIVTYLVRRLATERAMDPAPVVVVAERRQLSLQVHRIPEQSLVEELSAYRSYQALNERVTQWHISHRLDRLDFQHPQVGLPSMISEQRVVVGAEITRKRLLRTSD